MPTPGARPDPVLEARWKTNETPRAIVDDAVRRATGAPPAELKRLLVSYSNDLFEARTRSGLDLIIRVHVDGGAGYFDRELWALSRCREAGLPVPEVLGVFDDERDGIQRTIAVQSKVPGANLRDGWDDDPKVSERSRLIEQAGYLLSRIHSIRTEGFGLIDASGTAPFPSWGALEDRGDGSETLRLADVAGLERRSVTRALERLMNGIDSHRPTTPGLLHGDFGPKHIITAGATVTGVIDFEFARGGYPEADLAFWRYHEPLTFATLCSGYGAPGHSTLIMLHEIAISLSYLDYHGRRGELVGDFRDLVARRLAEALEA